ncbi:MAG: 4-hydroxythreonine-4-phosphate dehydrogenase PdxA [Candidatus Thioglobus sp.]|nr:4-hydroxythreonine-4-phosphate dehydrogenase PdxA [Candidatus Thioglobus sp.]
MTIAFTPGEPAGIGVDLLIIHAQKNADNILAFTDPDLLLQRAKQLNLPIRIKENETSGVGEICVFPIKTNAKVQAGKLNPDNSKFVLKTLDIAIQKCLEKTCSALLTGPVHKGIINQAGFNFSGHTEYLANSTKTAKTVMMLATAGLRVALATTHFPLAKVAENITADGLEKTIHIIHNSLISFGIKSPKIVVCGLNPHAGEGGYMGLEEIEIINPLIKRLSASGYNLQGAVPADTAFTPDALRGVDVVLAMYHDQGLPVLKTLGFKKSVNITLGLPFIRTSVDHGTALDLVATGKINLGSFHTALAHTKQFISQTKS